jgi:1-acyl-sn-glycerol-3-phosphate acyltransferase
MSSRIGYRIFKHYVRFCMNHIMYRKHYILGEENCPPFGEPFVMPANHQNTAIDPILMILAQDNRSHPYVMAMGGVFTWHSLSNKFWDWLGMLPAFRMDFEGVEEAVSRTKYVIDFAAGKMVEEGNPVFLFPETNHHVEHWMRVWVPGYLEIAFTAAK